MNHYGQIITACQHQPTSEMPSKWHFAGGLIMAHFNMFAGDACESSNVILKTNIHWKSKIVPGLKDNFYNNVNC